MIYENRRLIQFAAANVAWQDAHRRPPPQPGMADR